MAKIIGSRISQLKVSENLSRIKKNITDGHDYFKDNFRRFNRSRKFIFESSLTDNDIALLSETGKPQIEFNIGEAFLSRLRGEFAMQEPTLNISPKSTSNQQTDAETIDFLERYLQQMIFNSNRDNLQYDILTDILSGGFSAVKVITQYAASIGPAAFEQEFKFERFFDPTLSVFDKTARLSHKGDGRYCAEIFPKTYDEFKDEYGSDSTKGIKFKSSDGIGGFNWSYSTAGGDKIVLIADYYEKRKKRVKIVHVAPTVDSPTMSVMTEKDYEEFAEEWSNSRIEQVPVVVASRKTEIETIDRYVICGDSILEHQQTDWKYLPHVFIDGNSLVMRQETEGASYQLTRPFLYQTEGIQRLMNFSGQCLANSLENIVQHKFMCALEGVPQQYTDPMIDIQRAAVLFYHAYDPNDPTRQLPPPQAAPNAPAPPEVAQTFMLGPQMMQTILGSYDASLGINDNQLSGKAIRNGAVQSNPVARPFIVSYMKGMEQIGTILLDRIPKIIRTPRTIPIVDKNGKRQFVKLNQQGGITLQYDADSLEVNIEPGVSFEIQRQQAFEMIIQLMQISEEFAQFMNNSPDGIKTLLDNVDIRGIEMLKMNVEKFLQEKQQKQQQMEQIQQQQVQQQMQMQAEQLKIMSRPMELKEQEIQIKAMKDAKEIEIKEDQVAINFMKAESEIENQGIENALRASEIQARNIRSEVDLERSDRDHHHRKAMDILGLHHERESLKGGDILNDR